jgi:hypothetical protein
MQPSRSDARRIFQSKVKAIIEWPLDEEETPTVDDIWDKMEKEIDEGLQKK